VRPIRLAVRVPEIKVVVSTLMSAVAPAVFALVICLLIFYILAILGVTLFSGKYNRCLGSDAYGNDIDQYIWNHSECKRTKKHFF
jgi:hypothetical protein